MTRPIVIILALLAVLGRSTRGVAACDGAPVPSWRSVVFDRSAVPEVTEAARFFSPGAALSRMRHPFWNRVCSTAVRCWS